MIVYNVVHKENLFSVKVFFKNLYMLKVNNLRSISIERQKGEKHYGKSPICLPGQHL